MNEPRPQASDSTEILVEVAYALPRQQLIIPLRVPQGTTAQQAVLASGITEKFPEIDLARNKIGVFGKLTSLETVLRHKDRVEIYRPLIADPKEIRRKRVAQGKAVKQGGAPGKD